jgi:negative regulator of sigma E activity
MDKRPHEPPHYPLPEVIQPDPTLEPNRNLFGTAMVYLGAAAIVVLVLYGLTRPEGPQQEMASTPSPATQTAPAGGTAAPPPSTTGQGSSSDQKGDQARDQAKPETGQGQPTRSDSSNDTGSKNQPRQQAQ